MLSITNLIAAMSLLLFALFQADALPMALSRVTGSSDQRHEDSAPVPGVTFHVDIDDGGSPFPHVKNLGDALL
jgi:hypothetical protein